MVMRFLMMPPFVSALLAFLVSLFQSRWAMQLKILALQHQVAVYKQTVHRPQLHPTDRLFWAWLSRLLWAIVNMRQQFTDSLAYLTHPDRLNFCHGNPSTVSWDVTC